MKRGGYYDKSFIERKRSAQSDAGHQNLPWSVNEPSGFLAGIDFNAILDNPQAREIIQSLPVQPLYYGLKKKGLAECLAVLPSAISRPGCENRRF